jgi:single-stranded-DNA-specific exonuclease
MAAGLSIKRENIHKFRAAINQSAKKLPREDFTPIKHLSGILETADVDGELLEILESFEPYGEGNLRPTFLLEDAEVVSIRLMGVDRSHSRIEVRQYPHQRVTIELIAFRTVFEMPEDKKITCSYSISKNEFNNRITPQLLIDKIY